MVKYARMKCARVVSRVNTRLRTKLLIVLLVMLIAVPIIGAGCEGEGGGLPALSSPSKLSSTLVPNIPLDVYVCARQDNPTMIPAEVVDAPHDIAVESLAVWGVPAEDGFAFGMGLTLTSASDASRLYDEIKLGESNWKKLSGNTIYLVHGSGTAAESLKTAISNSDFKYYDDSEALGAVATMPDIDTTRLAAIGLAKPSEALIGFIARDADSEESEMINMIMKLVSLKVIAGGVYSPHQIDMAEMARAMKGDRSNILTLDLGVLVVVKSGLPGLIVEPAVKKLLMEKEFAETNLGEFTLYKGYWEVSGDKAVPVLVRIDGNYIFAAISGQESYAETLITSINK